MDSRRFPPWFGVGFFAALCLLGSSFNCVCFGDDEHDWCEEHDCDDDVFADDDTSDDDVTPGKSKEEQLGKHGDDDDDTGKPDDDTGDDDTGDDDVGDDDTSDDDIGDDDTSDDDTSDDDTSDDDTSDDDTTGDDDTVSGPYTCADFCAMENGICIDWVGSGYTCLDFCASCMNQGDLDCLETCPPDPLTDGCVCVHTCLAAYLSP